ncbi:MAG: Efflux transporter periplasmic adaptor subunit [uncultured Sulfurovum sp.]|uniref:Efflux transporter periplasmic adaptor subunit n=1 Tax=uncultured Sulfurovum sp. TaxID=269237 RepID=A0A6S6TI19_9BACT|nr:MAG: Efflux transporter periplasmic adaptor subunit [uncultured Sulfurovum sp.]
MSFMILSLSFLSAEEVYATFTVEAERSANLAFSASGIVNDVKVELGSVVKKGQKLVSLENSDVRSMVAIAKANLRTAQVSANYAQKEYKRQSQVKHLLDASAFDKFAQNRDVNNATVSQLKANLKYQEVLLKKTSLYAPFDGIIYEKLVEVGDVVSGQMISTILKIQSAHDVKLIVSFDEKYWDKVKKGATFKYTLTGSDKSYEGKISKIYPTIENKTHKLRAEVKAKDIKVGLFGTGTIVTE